MRSPRRLARTLVLVFVAAAAASAHAKAPPPVAPPEEEVEHALRHLDGTSPREVAWGAFYAAEQRLEAAAPRIVERLRAEAPDDVARLPLRIALVDALVVLDPAIDPAIVLPHATGLLEHGVVTFLARHPERYGGACLALFRRADPSRTAWVALGNALAAARTPGFAPELLRDLEVTLTVRVVAKGQRRVHPPVGSVVGCGYGELPEGWPPPRLHRLFAATESRADDGVCFPGRHPIVSVRCGRDDRQVWTCSSVEAAPASPDAIRLAWLEAWGCVPRPVEAASLLEVVWTSRGDFVRRVVAARDERSRALRAIVAAVRRVAPPTGPWDRRGEGPPGPRVRVVYEDLRDPSPGVPLPDLPPAGEPAPPRRP